MILPGLTRIARLLKGADLSWSPVHVAGTNGKGSVCSYISALLDAAGVSTGRFTSPHLVDRWDCITINGNVVDRDLFQHVDNAVRRRDWEGSLKASEFELLTATAFEIFNEQRCEIGVVETGLGGRYDATNLLDQPLISVITKIGLDHQALLGDSLEAIAVHKAGIMKKNAPCLVDGSNTQSVLNVLKDNAQITEVSSYELVTQRTHGLSEHSVWKVLDEDTYEEHQQMNIMVAYEAFRRVAAKIRPSLKTDTLIPVIAQTHYPGRLQRLLIPKFIDQNMSPFLLDGAHNAQSAEVLGIYVNRNLRHIPKQPVTWVIAMSEGRIIQDILSHLLNTGDNLIATSFGPVAGMPWVTPISPKDIAECATRMGAHGHYGTNNEGLAATIRLAVKAAAGGPIVVAGSLYLVSDILRTMRGH